MDKNNFKFFNIQTKNTYRIVFQKVCTFHVSRNSLKLISTNLYIQIISSILQHWLRLGLGIGLGLSLGLDLGLWSRIRV